MNHTIVNTNLNFYASENTDVSVTNEQNDDVSSNPFGRGISNSSRFSNALLRCRRPLYMASFNANTLREEARMLELAQCSETNKIDVIGMQEH